MKNLIYTAVLALVLASFSASSNNEMSLQDVYKQSLNTPQYQSMVEMGQKRILELDNQHKQILKETNQPLVAAPALSILEIVGVLSNSAGWTYVNNINDFVHPYNVSDIIAIHTIEYGYGHSEKATFNGSTLQKYDSVAIVDSSNTIIGWQYGYLITNWSQMADSGTATYQSTSVNSPWNTESDSLYIP